MRISRTKLGILAGAALTLMPAAMAVATLTINTNVTIDGDLDVLGAISKGSGSFVIDHPLDPKNRLLYHSFVESPEAKNVYVGRVTLGENGTARIALPDYFEALNKDFRYQLTPLSESMPNLHVKEPIRHNEFMIAGGTAGGVVSWLVTGVRRDPYIEANPIVNEVEKGPDALYDVGECVFKPLCE